MLCQARCEVSQKDGTPPTRTGTGTGPPALGTGSVDAPTPRPVPRLSCSIERLRNKKYHVALGWNRGNVEAWETLYENIAEKMELTISPEHLELAFVVITLSMLEHILLQTLCIGRNLGPWACEDSQQRTWPLDGRCRNLWSQRTLRPFKEHLLARRLSVS